jgi:hypothetical protein
MLKLTLKQKIRLWLRQYRRSVVITIFSLFASLLLLGFNSQHVEIVQLLTLVQLAAGALLVIVVVILCD